MYRTGRYTSAFVGNFLLPRQAQTKKADPASADFRQVAGFYNGPQYEAHLYHERLSHWFR
ncbi:N-acetylmuramidase domain-containing protein [Sedimenticola selenatireducens]|uniref:DUF3380 domain-containing protein n=1 Tax=Sedimenticola selenatireducens TaxID=191960 RepID=A0A558DU54_9GAMM|nr:DUF3380 domain-containing protein [Sedimenticola selenatireducens]TVT64556.1 MAG: DUF3380 domain-containing protein [Sedimenticola selenatireducens]